MRCDTAKKLAANKTDGSSLCYIRHLEKKSMLVVDE
jgi:hypothetical protein